MACSQASMQFIKAAEQVDEAEWQKTILINKIKWSTAWMSCN